MDKREEIRGREEEGRKEQGEKGGKGDINERIKIHI